MTTTCIINFIIIWSSPGKSTGWYRRIRAAISGRSLPVSHKEGLAIIKVTIPLLDFLYLQRFSSTELYVCVVPLKIWTTDERDKLNLQKTAGDINSFHSARYAAHR